VLIVLVLGVASDVGTLVYHHDPPARARQSLGDDAAGVARSYHQNIGLHTVLRYTRILR
jgi:hypothetical protein